MQDIYNSHPTVKKTKTATALVTATFTGPIVLIVQDSIKVPIFRASLNEPHTYVK